MNTPVKAKTETLKVDQKFMVGVDVGGTKTAIMDNRGAHIHRFETSEYRDLYAILGEYFEAAGARPARMAVAMAGPRDAETGVVTPTNFPWPPFDPAEAERRYPGTSFESLQDMDAVMAGIVHGSDLDLKQLKPGRAVPQGTTVGATISTGMNTCMAAWDRRSKHYVYVTGEAGHVGFQPYSEAEDRHLKHIFTKYEHPSVELALSGMYGIESWVEHSPEMRTALELADAVKRAEQAGRPVGAVLLAFATEGNGPSRDAARSILNNMGALAGNVMADYALYSLATGGMYMTGSVSLGLAEYWAEETDFVKAFVRRGTDTHAPWLEETLKNTPIYLVMDPNVAVKGALAWAQEG
jgi:glucokinase